MIVLLFQFLKFLHIAFCKMERALLTEGDVCQLVQRLYGLQTIKQTALASYDDVNIQVNVKSTSTNKFIREVSEDGYVLKVLNTLDSKKVNFVGKLAKIYHI